MGCIIVCPLFIHFRGSCGHVHLPASDEETVGAQIDLLDVSLLNDLRIRPLLQKFKL